MPLFILTGDDDCPKQYCIQTRLSSITKKILFILKMPIWALDVPASDIYYASESLEMPYSRPTVAPAIAPICARDMIKPLFLIIIPGADSRDDMDSAILFGRVNTGSGSPDTDSGPCRLTISGRSVLTPRSSSTLPALSAGFSTTVYRGLGSAGGFGDGDVDRIGETLRSPCAPKEARVSKLFRELC